MVRVAGVLFVVRVTVGSSCNAPEDVEATCTTVAPLLVQLAQLQSVCMFVPLPETRNPLRLWHQLIILCFLPQSSTRFRAGSRGCSGPCSSTWRAGWSRRRMRSRTCRCHSTHSLDASHLSIVGGARGKCLHISMQPSPANITRVETLLAGFGTLH